MGENYRGGASTGHMRAMGHVTMSPEEARHGCFPQGLRSCKEKGIKLVLNQNEAGNFQMGCVG